MAKMDPNSFKGRVMEIRKLPDSPYGNPQYELTIHRDEIVKLRTGANMPVANDVTPDLIGQRVNVGIAGKQRLAIVKLERETLEPAKEEPTLE